METAFPIVKQAAPERRTAIVVSVPHFGTQPLPHITRDDYREPWFDGATVVATPFSRMFVDVNRRRDDFEHHEGEVRSKRGVVRTHTTRDVPIFSRPLELADLEERLRTLYDPYYETLERLLTEFSGEYGYALLLDGHTGSPRRMKDHQVIIGTRKDATCAPELADGIAEIFTRHGFEVHRNITARPRHPARDQRVAADGDLTRRLHRARLARRDPREGGREHRADPRVPPRGAGDAADRPRARPPRLAEAGLPRAPSPEAPDRC
jgi:N-formylglutamate amidohydrolase